jgi:hypothetical protein
VPVTWGALEKGKYGGIVRDLRHVIRRGMWGFNVDALTALPALFGEEDEDADARIVRERVLAFLMADDPSRSPDARPDTLTVTTRIRLTLFRATEELRYATLSEARADAAEARAHADDKHPAKMITAEGVRKPGGLEYKVVERLAEDISHAYAPVKSRAAKPRPPTRRKLSSTSRARYQPPTAAALAQGFWWRDATLAHIEGMADLAPLTIFAGADGPADVGPPLHQDLLTAVLLDRIHKRGLLEAVPPDHRQAAAEGIVDALAAVCPPTQVGSIIRGIDRFGGEVALGEEIALAHAIWLAIAENRSVDAFVAEAIVQLAFTAKAVGREVEVISAHFDTDILTAQQYVRERDDRLTGIELHDCGDELPPDDLDSRLVPLMRLHGRHGDKSKQRLVIGEADFFADEPVAVGSEGHTEGHSTRASVVERALQRGAVIFVGTSLTEPGLVSVLGGTRGLPGMTYALLLPPNLARAGLSVHSHPVEYATALDLLGRRYLHLGVTPVFVDFEQQVPQMLREVAHCIAAGSADYQPYSDRLGEWWARAARLFGYDDDGTGSGRINVELRDRGRERLMEMRDLSTIFSHLQSSPDENIQFDVWLRNPPARTLFKIATTAARGPTAGSVPKSQPLHGEDPTPEQRAFREGRTITMQLRRRGGRHYYVVATPLVLHDAPWHHLPVGIVTITSTQRDGALAAVASNQDDLRTFTTRIPRRLRGLLELLEG